jgi:purine-binding chemotaxis protein CheW
VAGPSAPTDALLFELAGSRMALVAGLVAEVVRAVEIEPLPRAPDVVSGVINVRGALTPVIDMRRRLGMACKELSPDDHFILADCGPQRVALHVDRALDLLSLNDVSVELLAEQAASPYVSGAAALEDGVLVIYDLAAFLSASEASALSSALSANNDNAASARESA